MVTQFPETRTHLVTASVADVASSIQTISIACALLGSIASAPVQCGRDPDPETSIEEGPGEAIYGLAEQFREQGNVEAQKSTLTYIIKRFPSSRFAKRAKQDLEALGGKVDPGSAP